MHFHCLRALQLGQTTLANTKNPLRPQLQKNGEAKKRKDDHNAGGLCLEGGSGQTGLALPALLDTQCGRQALQFCRRPFHN